MRINKELKEKILNSLMIGGNKETNEKILLKSIKFLQKSTLKIPKNIIQLSIINSTPTFKIDTQRLKKGKRKSTKKVSAFIKNESLRIILSLKNIKNASKLNKNKNLFFITFAKEILLSSQLNSLSIEKKNSIQQQIILNKKYISKFKW